MTTKVWRLHDKQGETSPVADQAMWDARAVYFRAIPRDQWLTDPVVKGPCAYLTDVGTVEFAGSERGAFSLDELHFNVLCLYAENVVGWLPLGE